MEKSEKVGFSTALIPRPQPGTLGQQARRISYTEEQSKQQTLLTNWTPRALSPLQGNAVVAAGGYCDSTRPASLRTIICCLHQTRTT